MEIKLVNGRCPQLTVGHLNLGDIFHIRDHYFIVAFSRVNSRDRFSLTTIGDESTWNGTYDSLDELLRSISAQWLELGVAYFPVDKIKLTIEYDPAL